MPRQARMDAPGTLHHVIIRGLDRGKIVADEVDREMFVVRLGVVARATRTAVYAWAVLPNHVHLLVRSGPAGLPPFMRRLLTGYAITFNHRHRRYGHLFQNRYKSILCEEDSYFRELVRYIHLNPIRAGLVPDLAGLDRYPWCGHAAVMGRVAQPWQDRRYVLAWFGGSPYRALRAYRQYLREGIPLGRRPELVGGGLVRSLGGWAEVRAMRRRGTRVVSDPRVLGTGAFVERLLEVADGALKAGRLREQGLHEGTKVIRTACARAGITPEELRAGSRRACISSVRAEVARHLVTDLGLSLADTARQLGVSTSAISRVVGRRGQGKSI